LFEFDGSNFFPVRQPQKVGEDVYEFQASASDPRFYYVGVNTQNLAPIILGQEELVVVKSHCQDFRSAAVESPLNEAYQALKLRLNEMQSKASLQNRQYQMSAGEAREKLAAEMKALDEEKLALLDSMKK